MATEAGFGSLAAVTLRPGRTGLPVGALWVADRASRTAWGESDLSLLRQLAALAADGIAAEAEAEAARLAAAGSSRKVA